MDGPLYRIKVAAEKAGVSEQVLRAWERRYGLVSPKRSPGGYRGYTAADIELLKRVKELLGEGLAIGDVAPLLPKLRREIKESKNDLPAPNRQQPERVGERLALWQSAILDAAQASAQAHVEAVLDEALAALPVLQVVDELLIPVQREVGNRWHLGQLTVAQEHLVSHTIRSRLYSLLRAAPTTGRRRALCACFPEEEHEVGLLGVALRLRYSGYQVTYLGARTPTEHVIEMARQLRPDLIALSLVSRLEKTDFRRQLKQLAHHLPKARIVIGGAGAETWPDVVADCEAELVTADNWAALTGSSKQV